VLILLLYVELRPLVVRTRGPWKSALYEEGRRSELMTWLVVMPMSAGGGGNGGLGFGWTVALLELLAPSWGMEGWRWRSR
jgi:hypothetical protein